jgi:hypothetical protein
MFGTRMSGAVLRDFCRSGRRIDLFLRISQGHRTYHAIRVVRVESTARVAPSA